MRQPAYDDGPGIGRLLKVHNWSWTVVLLAVNLLVFLGMNHPFEQQIGKSRKEFVIIASA